MEVMLGEHKARVIDILGHPRICPWLGGQDDLIVWLQLDPPIDCLGSFAINLPVKDYSRDEFFADVRRLGKISLDVHIDLWDKDREKREMIKEVKARVYQVAKNLREKFEI